MREQLKSLIKQRVTKGTKLYSVLNRVYKVVRYKPNCFYSFIRAQGPVMKLFGPLHPRSRNVIILDITYRCHVGCINCNRSLGKGQAPSNESMTIEQVQKFVDEMIHKQIRWPAIYVEGGEATLHPQLFEILNILLEYKHSYSPKTRLELHTSGYGDKINDILAKVPEEIIILNSSKDSNVQLHYPFNMAPKDSILYKYVDYANGCVVGSQYGMLLTPYGYYACSVMGGIDRIFGFDLGRKELPSREDDMFEELRTFCSLCGHFKCAEFTYKSLMSPTWKVAYEQYKKERKRISLYGA